MTIIYDRVVNKNRIDKVVVEDVERISCHRNNVYYWKIGQPKFMYRLCLYDELIQNVRIFNGKTKD